MSAGILAEHGATVVFLVLGWCAHLMRVLRSVSQERGVRVWPYQFITMRPYRITLSVFGAMGGYAALMQADDLMPGTDVLTPFTAFGVGLCSDLVVDILRSVFSERIKEASTRASNGKPVASQQEDPTVVRGRDV